MTMTDEGHEQTQAAMDIAVSNGVPGVLARVHDRHGTWTGSAGVADLSTCRQRQPQDRYRIGSISKMFIATVVLQLVAEGQLNLDDRVETWLPGLVRGHRKVTLRQLLNHTSGIFDYFEDCGFQAKMRGVAFLRHRYETWTPEHLVALAMTHGPTFEPGTRAEYASTDYVLAAMVIEQVTGQPHRVEVKERIIEPLGLNSTTVPGTDPAVPQPSGLAYTQFCDQPLGTTYDVTEFNPSWSWAMGEIISNAVDLDRFLSVLLRGELLAEAQLKEMMTPEPFSTTYGLGLIRRTLPCGTEIWGHDGLLPGSQSVAYATRDAQHRLIFNFNGDWRAYTACTDDTDDAAAVILAEFCGTAPVVTPVPSHETTPAWRRPTAALGGLWNR